LEFVKHDRLQTLQSKAESLRHEINMLEEEKTKAMSQIFRLKRIKGEVEETLAQKRKEITHLNKEI
jgi:prefoldin subunit 5